MLSLMHTQLSCPSDPLENSPHETSIPSRNLHCLNEKNRKWMPVPESVSYTHLILPTPIQVIQKLWELREPLFMVHLPATMSVTFKMCIRDRITHPLFFRSLEHFITEPDRPLLLRKSLRSLPVPRLRKKEKIKRRCPI